MGAFVGFCLKKEKRRGESGGGGGGEAGIARVLKDG